MSSLLPADLRLAGHLEKQITGRCRETREGWPTWGPLETPPLPSVIRPDGYWDLYIGVPGTALFLGAMHQVTGAESPRSLCLRSIAPIRENARSLAVPPGLGAVVGIGSWIYALLRTGQLVNEPELVEEAHGLTCALTEESISRDRHLDFVYGSAGLILALLALDRVSPGPNRQGAAPLEIAVACAEHLMRLLPSRKPVAGIAHGMAGIALALARLFRRTGRRGFWDAASDEIARERELSLEGGWCRGATGIALARLGLLSCVPDERERAGVEEEIDRALEEIFSIPVEGPDHVCCGNMGRVEALLYAAQTTGRPEHLEAARDQALQVARNAAGRGRFEGDHGGRLDASLFRGAAGVGYAYLRLVSPDLPCFLVLD